MTNRTETIQNFIYEKASVKEIQEIILSIRESLDDTFYHEAPNRYQMEILQSLKSIANEVSENFYLEAKQWFKLFFGL